MHAPPPLVPLFWAVPCPPLVPPPSPPCPRFPPPLPRPFCSDWMFDPIGRAEAKNTCRSCRGVWVRVCFCGVCVFVCGWCGVCCVCVLSWAAHGITVWLSMKGARDAAARLVLSLEWPTRTSHAGPGSGFRCDDGDLPLSLQRKPPPGPKGGGWS